MVGPRVCEGIRGFERAHAWTTKRKRGVADAPLFVTVYQPRRNGTNVRAGADEEENDEKKRLEVEECGLWVGAHGEGARSMSVRKNRLSAG